MRGREFDHQCLWVVRNTITSSDKIDKMLDFALENNFNHLNEILRYCIFVFFPSFTIIASFSVSFNSDVY